MARSLWNRMTTRLLSGAPTGPDARNKETAQDDDTQNLSHHRIGGTDIEANSDWIRIKSDVAFA
jgi:hypothetical protein